MQVQEDLVDSAPLLQRNENLEADFSVQVYVQEFDVNGKKRVGFNEKWNDYINEFSLSFLFSLVVGSLCTYGLSRFSDINILALSLFSFLFSSGLATLLVDSKSINKFKFSRNLKVSKCHRFCMQFGLDLDKPLLGQEQAIFSFISCCESAASKYAFYTNNLITGFKNEIVKLDLKNPVNEKKAYDLLLEVFDRYESGFSLEVETARDTDLKAFIKTNTVNSSPEDKKSGSNWDSCERNSSEYLFNQIRARGGKDAK